LTVYPAVSWAPRGRAHELCVVVLAGRYARGYMDWCFPVHSYAWRSPNHYD